LDGVFVLGTDTDFNPLEAMLCYKQLWTVKQTFGLPNICRQPGRPSTRSMKPFAAVCSAAFETQTETAIKKDGKRFIVHRAPQPALLGKT
jgi:hypothetical protein